jgi:hypothetical protein
MPIFDVQMSILSAELGYATAVTSYQKALAEIEFLSGHVSERANGLPQRSAP